MDNSTLAKKNPTVVRPNRPVPISSLDLNKAIREQRRQLRLLTEEPERCRLLKKARENWDIGQDLLAMRVATRERFAQCRVKHGQERGRENGCCWGT